MSLVDHECVGGTDPTAVAAVMMLLGLCPAHQQSLNPPATVLDYLPGASYQG
jgi:hypothetical protein